MLNAKFVTHVRQNMEDRLNTEQLWYYIGLLNRHLCVYGLFWVLPWSSLCLAWVWPWSSLGLGLAWVKCGSGLGLGLV